MPVYFRSVNGVYERNGDSSVTQESWTADRNVSLILRKERGVHILLTPWLNPDSWRGQIWRFLMDTVHAFWKYIWQHVLWGRPSFAITTFRPSATFWVQQAVPKKYLKNGGDIQASNRAAREVLKSRNLACFSYLKKNGLLWKEINRHCMLLHWELHCEKYSRKRVSRQGYVFLKT